MLVNQCPQKPHKVNFLWSRATVSPPLWLVHSVTNDFRVAGVHREQLEATIRMYMYFNILAKAVYTYNSGDYNSLASV